MANTEVVKRAVGHWELLGNDDDLGCSYFCSNCQACYDEEWFYPHKTKLAKIKDLEEVPFKFCPNCGARMEEAK